MPPAHDLARRYAEALAALRAIHRFDDWLGDHWHERCPVPAGPPTARTRVRSGEAIVWYESSESVIGFLPDADGCFRVARREGMPDFALPGAFAPEFDSDVLISAAIRDDLQPPGR